MIASVSLILAFGVVLDVALCAPMQNINNDGNRKNLARRYPAPILAPAELQEVVTHQPELPTGTPTPVRLSKSASKKAYYDVSPVTSPAAVARDHQAIAMDTFASLISDYGVVPMYPPKPEVIDVENRASLELLEDFGRWSLEDGGGGKQRHDEWHRRLKFPEVSFPTAKGVKFYDEIDHAKKEKHPK